MAIVKVAFYSANYCLCLQLKDHVFYIFMVSISVILLNNQ